MKLFFAVIVLTICVSSTHCFSQINQADSTVQVVGYWSKNDKESFLYTSDKYTVVGSDTTNRKITKTEIDITVLDSTATSYTIEWLYKNIKSNSTDPFELKFYPLMQNTKVIIKTDEMGSFVEVVNVKELQEFGKHMVELLKKNLKGVSDGEAMANALLSRFESKESIEHNMIDEIYQFYMFHGGKYKLDEPVKIDLELPNVSGGKPIDAQVVIMVTEINAAEDTYVIRSSQIVDKAQATEATFQYLRQMNELDDNFTRDQMPDVVIQETIGARMHGSGWATYTVKTKSVATDNTTDVEEWTIELQ